ncbi:hypothetical protein ANCCEY_01180 [Ancylostoma ceylanicum]|uniref:Presenilin n=1 Tax=Ancylostoma ceylanicum TaxID=53326 RepID=A0A0D6MAV5_9BILA|nr:hypothetical protein ANCCEY_01180 [Ancylostoma ceylanicum]
MSSSKSIGKTLYVKGIDARHDEEDAITGEKKRRGENAAAAGSSRAKAKKSTSHRQHEKNYGPKDMVKVFVPVSICMTIVIICTRNVEVYQKDIILRTPYVIYHDPEAETPTKLWHSMVNAAVLLCVVVVATFGVLALFYCKCYRATLILMAAMVTLTIMRSYQRKTKLEIICKDS